MAWDIFDIEREARKATCYYDGFTSPAGIRAIGPGTIYVNTTHAPSDFNAILPLFEKYNFNFSTYPGGCLKIKRGGHTWTRPVLLGDLVVALGKHCYDRIVREMDRRHL